MESTMKRAFTLLETLVAFAILAIGFSALYYWFLTFSTISRHSNDRLFAQRILRNQAENLAAFPNLARDSIWPEIYRSDTFWVSQSVIDSVKREQFLEDSSWNLSRKKKFLSQPIDVHLKVFKRQANGFQGEQLYLKVGGINHVAP